MCSDGDSMATQGRIQTESAIELAFERPRANQLLAERWLLAAGLAWACAQLWGVVRAPSGCSYVKEKGQ